MSRADTYVRIPHTIAAEPLYMDDHLLATWIRLYLAADLAYPFLAPLPRIRRSVRESLIVQHWIEQESNGFYSIPGLREQREKLSAAGRIGGLASAKSPKSPTFTADEPSDEPFDHADADADSNANAERETYLTTGSPIDLAVEARRLPHGGLTFEEKPKTRHATEVSSPTPEISQGAKTTVHGGENSGESTEPAALCRR